MKLRAFLGAAALLAAGCGDDGESSPPSGTGGSGGSGGGGSSELCKPGSGDVDLAGTWAIQGNLNVRLQGGTGTLVSLCPDPQERPASLLLKVEMTGSGTSYQQKVSLCEITLPTVTGSASDCNDENTHIETEINPSPTLNAYLPSKDIPEVPLTLGAAQVGQAYNPAPFAVVLGAELANAQTDPLPKWDASKSGCTSTTAVPADCVIDFDKVGDEDGDGDPGVTLGALGKQKDGTTAIQGNAFVALRVAPALTGTIANANCVTGSLTSKLEYSIIDSDVKLGPTEISTSQVIDQLPPFQILPTSTFRMLRANGSGDNDFDSDKNGSVSCAEIIANRAKFLK
jgi:hypothetical protein